MLKGLDVSHHNPPKTVPWKGYDFGCIRVSYGRTADKLAHEHLARARDAGVPNLLAYHYLNLDVKTLDAATSAGGVPASAQGARQVEFFLEQVARHEAAVGPLALGNDVEDLPPPAKPWPRAEYSQAMGAWYGRLRELTARPAALYGSPGYLMALAASPIVRGSPLWVAHWNVAQPMPMLGWTKWRIWQHAVTAGVDRNVFDGTHEDWRRTFHPALPYKGLGGVVQAVEDAMGRRGAEAFASRDEGPVIPPKR